MRAISLLHTHEHTHTPTLVCDLQYFSTPENVALKEETAFELLARPFEIDDIFKNLFVVPFVHPFYNLK